MCRKGGGRHEKEVNSGNDGTTPWIPCVPLLLILNTMHHFSCYTDTLMKLTDASREKEGVDPSNKHFEKSDGAFG